MNSEIKEILENSDYDKIVKEKIANKHISSFTLSFLINGFKKQLYMYENMITFTEQFGNMSVDILIESVIAYKYNFETKEFYSNGIREYSLSYRINNSKNIFVENHAHANLLTTEYIIKNVKKDIVKKLLIQKHDIENSINVINESITSIESH
jgi:hypothetical protein